jgi:hypothetical protein
MATIVNYEPLQLRFGGVFPDTSGPDISTFGGDLPSQAGSGSRWDHKLAEINKGGFIWLP